MTKIERAIQALSKARDAELAIRWHNGVLQDHEKMSPEGRLAHPAISLGVQVSYGASTPGAKEMNVYLRASIEEHAEVILKRARLLAEADLANGRLYLQRSGGQDTN